MRPACLAENGSIVMSENERDASMSGCTPGTSSALSPKSWARIGMPSVGVPRATKRARSFPLSPTSESRNANAIGFAGAAIAPAATEVVSVAGIGAFGRSGCSSSSKDAPAATPTNAMLAMTPTARALKRLARGVDLITGCPPWQPDGPPEAVSWFCVLAEANVPFYKESSARLKGRGVNTIYVTIDAGGVILQPDSLIDVA